MSPKGKAAKAPLLEAELAELIQWIRGEKVMLDRDLARLYQVEVKVLNQAVKRNSSRFPADFMFQLTAVEAGYLRSQSVTLDGVEAAASSVQGRGKHLKYRPYAFTEQGVAMLSSVLRSDRAVTVNIEIMRAFADSTRVGRGFQRMPGRRSTPCRAEGDRTLLLSFSH